MATHGIEWSSAAGEMKYWKYKYTYRRYKSNHRITCGGTVTAADRYDALRKIKQRAKQQRKIDLQIVVLEERKRYERPSTLDNLLPSNMVQQKRKSSNRWFIHAMDSS